MVNLVSIVCPTLVYGVLSLLFASFASIQIYMAKLASKQRTSNICLPTSKNVFDPNEKLFCLPTCKMLNKRCLTDLVGAKRQHARTGYSNYLMSGKQCWSVSPGLKEHKHEFYHSVICLVTTFHSMSFKLTNHEIGLRTIADKWPTPNILLLLGLYWKGEHQIRMHPVMAITKVYQNSNRLT